jgi:hypothetical protein
MNTSENNNQDIRNILKEAYAEIQPPDSWDALRGRIDDKINNTDKLIISKKGLNATVIFWRRTALALAACLVLASILLINSFFTSSNGNSQNKLLTRGQVTQLGTVFSHIQELFGQQQPWMLVDAGGKGEIGVDNSTTGQSQTGKVIIIRLAINTQNKQQYYDLVALSDQQVKFSIPAIEGSDVAVSLKPVLANGGKITIEIQARLDNGRGAETTATIADNRFTSLVKVQSNGDWVSIDAVGQSAYSI